MGSIDVRLLVLAALEEFAPVGGASIELVAWDLDRDITELQDIWIELFTEGLLEPSGVDQIFGEAMYRLSTAGKAELKRRQGER